MQSVLLVVDAANVVGSVPDGWWKDRVGATERLRDQLVDVAALGHPALGDDALVEVVRAASGPCVVATADRELIARVTALGAQIVGPRTVRGG